MSASRIKPDAALVSPCECRIVCAEEETLELSAHCRWSQAIGQCRVWEYAGCGCSADSSSAQTTRHCVEHYESAGSEFEFLSCEVSICEWHLESPFAKAKCPRFVAHDTWKAFCDFLHKAIWFCVSGSMVLSEEIHLSKRLSSFHLPCFTFFCAST